MRPPTVSRLAYASIRSRSASTVVLARSVGDGDAEPVRPDAADGDLVRRAAQLEVDRRGRRWCCTCGRPPRAVSSRRVTLDLLLVLVGLDAGRDERDPGVPVGDEPALAADPVDPAGVGACRR